MKAANDAKINALFSVAVAKALRQAGQAARKTARAYGTPIYVWRNGRVTIQKP